MRILIATGIYPPDIGGPAIYAEGLYNAFSSMGHKGVVVSYGWKRKLPTGARHIAYFFEVCRHIWSADVVIVLDTYSAAVPAIFAAKLFGRKAIIRVGGDFLWESYVERTKEKIFLSDFYRENLGLSLKENIIFYLTRLVLQSANAVAFSTEWQADIFKKAYGLQKEKIYLIENHFGGKKTGEIPADKNFLWAGRQIALKNITALKKAFSLAHRENKDLKLDIKSDLPHEKLLSLVKKCYAVILPSYSEVSPNFILDAISFGKPFIMTKDGGYSGKLGGLGLFVDPFNPEDIKEKILFLAEPDNYRECVNETLHFDFRHSYEEIAEEFLKLVK